MMKLQVETVGARTVVTVVAAGSWITMTSWQKGSLTLYVLVAFAMALLLAIWLAPKMNDRLGHRAQTVVEFFLYSGFITLVTAQSVAFAASAQYWYSIPPGLTIGIIPQIQSLWNRLLSILISIAIYVVVLLVSADISDFIQNYIHIYYSVVIASALSVKATEVVLISIHSIFGKIKAAIDAVRDAVDKITKRPPQ